MLAAPGRMPAKTPFTDRTERPFKMKIRLGSTALEVVQGDITQQDTDAIVNAANSQLAGGAGVDGAIHRAGGPSIMQETSECYPEGCPPGEAVVTAAGQLAAKWVIHTVGPIWQDGRQGEPALLAKACRSCLFHALDLGCESLAFPAISAGAYGYPLDLAANNLLKTAMDFVRWHRGPKLVRFVVFDDPAKEEFERALREVVPK